MLSAISAHEELSRLADLVCLPNQNRQLISLKKKMARISKGKTKQQRESALHEANALLANVSEGLAKNGKKNVDEQAEAGIAEALTLQSIGPSLESKLKLKHDNLHTRIAKQGKLDHVFSIVANKPKNMPKVTEQAN